MACSSSTLTSSPPLPTTSPIIVNESTTDMIDSLSSTTEEQLFPPNLRLNDDILSVHFNNVTSNVKKRHSLSDPCDSLIKYLSSNIEQQPPVQVHDDTLTNLSLSDTNPAVLSYENLLDFQSNINNNNKSDEVEEEEQQTMIESFISDTESEGSFSEDIESTISFQTNLTASITNLKSLLKTSTTPKNTSRRVIFDPLALLLDAAIIGELELVIKSAQEVRIFSFKISFF
jgi:hypothetical protein